MPRTVLGQDPEVLLALWANVLSWLVSTFAPSLLPRLLPAACAAEEEGGIASTGDHPQQQTRCISIGRPGGSEQLRLVRLRESVATCGYNIKHFCPPPYTPPLSLDSSISIDMPEDCVIVDNEAFSVNYADCCIRWGLYESAKRFVGYPIVPGFDVAGTVSSVGSGVSAMKAGDRVFGCTLFGAYSSRVLIPSLQLRPIPKGLTMGQAAALPAVSLTALHALSLAGHYPLESKYSNRAILIHSAAGGVGSMLVQMSKILGLSPVVGVVGSSSKVEEARALGCDCVIDKSSENLWDAAETASPTGYSAIMDANGVSTLQQSYDHLAPTGRLVVFGFHSNLPMGKAALDPLQWIRMAKKAAAMPKFDAMDLCTSNKSILGFNLSFFADEAEVVSTLFDQVCRWIDEERLKVPRVVEMDMERITEAHELIQSGTSVGKIVVKTK
eukprot:CAMPEP_0178598026 /NCGR_PEP_ID=MMETSP0697-20121206/32519_2 /TAXON_ID=265572 /ORGANISM="Extubocellulus spinifer, Strain CCMP396" /LENGTH=440 /DNA_ID=CAMNT_0020235759 /DNA_START=157 /DNA_END=1479 /DNA_ORIENTATION=-